MSLLSLLIAVVIFGLVYWALMRIASAFALPAQIVVLIEVLLVIIAVLWLLSAIGASASRPWSASP